MTADTFALCCVCFMAGYFLASVVAIIGFRAGERIRDPAEPVKVSCMLCRNLSVGSAGARCERGHQLTFEPRIEYFRTGCQDRQPFKP